MQRQTARLIVKIAGFNSEFPADAKVKNVEFHSKSNASAPQVTYTPYADGEGKAGSTYTVLVPMDAANHTVSLTVGSKAMTAKLQDYSYNVGKSYTYNLTVGKEKLEVGGNLDRLLNWQKTGLISLAVPFGDTTIYTEARLALRTGADGRLSLNIHTLRREPQLDFPYMGHTFSPEEKEQLLTQGNLGKTVELSPKKGEPFRAYVSVDRLTNELVSLRADRVQIPHEIKGVRLSEEQHRALTEGRPVQVEGMLSRHGKPFDATLQVNAEKRGIEFIFKDSLSNKERLKSSAREAPAVRQAENKPQKRGIGR